MRLAIVGKGGSGKTAFSAMVALTISSQGVDVLALDLDTNPGLAVSLGLEPETGGLPDEAVEERPDAAYGFGLAHDVDPGQAVRRYGVNVAPHLTFLGLGAITDAKKSVRRHLTAVLELSQRFVESNWSVIGDLEAGPTTPFEGRARFADLAAVLVTASPASVLAARRILGILEHEQLPAVVLVSRARPGDVKWVEGQLGPVFGFIPWDGAIDQAERRGSLLAADRGTPAWVATQLLVQKLRAREPVEVRA